MTVRSQPARNQPTGPENGAHGPAGRDRVDPLGACLPCVAALPANRLLISDSLEEVVMVGDFLSCAVPSMRDELRRYFQEFTQREIADNFQVTHTRVSWHLPTETELTNRDDTLDVVLLTTADVVVDLSGVTHLASSGMQSLFHVSGGAPSSGTSINLVDLPDSTLVRRADP